MSDPELGAIERDHAMALMGREMQRRNEETRQKTECEVCGDDVPDHDFSTKFAAAGGVLAGPFCSDKCYWGFFGDE